MEQEPIEFYQAVRDAYRDLAQQVFDRFTDGVPPGSRVTTEMRECRIRALVAAAVAGGRIALRQRPRSCRRDGGSYNLTQLQHHDGRRIVRRLQTAAPCLQLQKR